MLFALLLAAAPPATQTPTTPVPAAPTAAAIRRVALSPVDPLTATIDAADAERFAAIYARTGGRPTAADIQRDYLDPGGRGVAIFTPGRIQSAAHLAQKVAANPALYDRAIRVCLPIVKRTEGELRAIYLALHGLFPERPLPRLYLVVGALNSGGTAEAGAQVLGLEVLCRDSATPEALREMMRSFYAHETVHTWQTDADAVSASDALLGSVLVEGAADFVATLVTGRQLDPARAAWGIAREAALWRQFVADLALTRGMKTLTRGTPAGDAYYRWVGNFGSAPAGWPGETGYWMGQRIWQRWYDRQPDKQVAIRRLLTIERPRDILADGAFTGDLSAPQHLR